MPRGGVRGLACGGDLHCGGSPRDEIEGVPFPDPAQSLVNFGRINVVALDDVEHGDVTAGAGVGRHHDVFGLGEAPHDVQDSGFADSCSGVGIFGSKQMEGCVSCHEEVTPGSRDEAGQQSDQVVVHVSWVPEGGSRCCHDGCHQSVNVVDGGILDAQPVDGDPIERRVVQDNHRVGVERQPFERQNRIVRLHHNIALVGPTREDRISLYEFLRIMIIEGCEEVAPHTRSRPPGNGVAQHEPLERVGVVGLAIDHVDDLFAVFFALSKATGPIVARSTAFLRYKGIFRIEEFLVRVCEFVDDARFQIDQQSARHVPVVVALVKENVFAIVGPHPSGSGCDGTTPLLE